MEVIIYDGVGKPLKVAPHETINAVLQHAERVDVGRHQDRVRPPGQT